MAAKKTKKKVKTARERETEMVNELNDSLREAPSVSAPDLRGCSLEDAQSEIDAALDDARMLVSYLEDAYNQAEEFGPELADLEEAE